MRIDLAGLSGPDAYRLLVSTVVPRPIAWVGTRSPEGVDNLAPFSFYMGVGSRPPALAFAVSRRGRDEAGQPLWKDTARNLRHAGDLTVSVVPCRLAEAMNATSAPLPPDVSELQAAGLTARPGERVAACYPAEAPVAMECRLLHSLEVGASTLFVAEVLLLHADDALVLPGPGGPVLDVAALDPLARLGGHDYTGLGALFTLPPPRPPTRAA